MNNPLSTLRESKADKRKGQQQQSFSESEEPDGKPKVELPTDVPAMNFQIEASSPNETESVQSNNHGLEQHLVNQFFDFDNGMRVCSHEADLETLFDIPFLIQKRSSVESLPLQCGQHASYTVLLQDIPTASPHMQIQICPKDKETTENQSVVQFHSFEVRQSEQPSLSSHQFDAKKLKASSIQYTSQSYRTLFSQIKNTNMPKKLLKMFRSFLRSKLKHPTPQGQTSKIREYSDPILYEGLLQSITRQLNRTNIDKAGTKELQHFFCGEEKTGHRKLMKECLSRTVIQEVLSNDSIPIDNKFSYLKCLKIMEWRMRIADGSLVTRVQSRY